MTALLILVVTVLGCLFLYLVGVDILEERINFQFYADSVTYHKAARGDLPGFEGIAESIAVAGNYLGPLLILQVAQQDYYVVLLINTCLLFISIASIVKSIKLDSLLLTAVLLVNPLTVSSLLSVNKEIVSLTFIALLLKALTTHSVWFLLAATVVSMMVRWQLFIFLLTLYALASPFNPLRERRGMTLAVLLIGLSILYLQLSPILEPIRIVFEESAAEYEGSGLYEWLQGWQEVGAYWLIFPLKASHLLFGLGLRFDRLIAPVDVYNDVWQLLHSTITLVLFVVLWRKRQFHLNNDLVYISIIYVAVFAMSPIYSPRYFYPVYVLWATALAAQFAPARLLRLPAGFPRRSGRRRMRARPRLRAEA